MPAGFKKVLFICVHNSARSQMAEAFLNRLGAGAFEAESAGLEPGLINPVVVRVMKEAGIDLSAKQTRDVFDLFRQGRSYHAVITVCDQANAEKCPVFPGRVRRIAWSFEDPSLFQGSEEEVIERTRGVRNEIEGKVRDFIREAGNLSYWI